MLGRLIVSVVVMAWCGIVYAAETQTYQYDARGRLIAVSRAGAINQGVQSIYAYDVAGNRTQVVVSGAQGGGPTFNCQYSINDVTVTAGVGAIFTLSRTGTGCTANVEVEYQTQNISALAGTHYQSEVGAVQFQNTGVMTRTFTVQTFAGSTTVSRQYRIIISFSNSYPGEGIVDSEGIGAITP